MRTIRQYDRRGSAILSRLFILVVALASGCATLPKDVDRTHSTAITDHESTTLGRMFADDAAAHPGKSGFAVVSNSQSAFRSRIAMCRLAERTIDVQYYIWDADVTGRTLTAELIKAANRGVRVRALIDDSTMTGRDNGLSVFDSHPNIEVRLFNPFANRGARIWGYITDLDRLNHRMHNKLIVMDSTISIIGGRNIGNHYFGIDPKANFRDLDIASVGPIVRDISASFDLFWNSSWAFPIEALRDESDELTGQQLLAETEKLRTFLAENPYPFPLNDEFGAGDDDLQQLADAFAWAPGKVAYDRPDEIASDEGTTGVTSILNKESARLKKELLVETAYFVPLDRGVAGAEGLIARGIRVRVLTNSLASNDVTAAHAGYKKYRKKLISAGVEMYELRPDSEEIRKEWSAVAANSKVSLHTKAMVFDRERVFIGSLNLDPRSTDINTEIGLLVESRELAEQVIAFMDAGISPDNAYRVELNEKGKLRWTTVGADGQPLIFTKEPETSALQRGATDFIKMLPVESQL
jgi:putative cardiolipin synthase